MFRYMSCAVIGIKCRLKTAMLRYVAQLCAYCGNLNVSNHKTDSVIVNVTKKNNFFFSPNTTTCPLWTSWSSLLNMTRG